MKTIRHHALPSQTAPSLLGNFVRGLLSQEFCGAVAPSIRVNAIAAREAARLFYDDTNDTRVVERVRKIECSA